MTAAEMLTTPSVSLIEGRPATTSLDIAEHFGKRHDHVVRSIKDLMANCPETFTAPNFGVSEYTDETGRTLPMFTVYFDGFMLLVMGYTGKKALSMKLAYISAFNAMREQQERQSQPFGNPERLDSPISRRTDPERKALTAIINTWVSMAPVHYAAARAQVNAHFGVASVDALTVAQVKEAIQWVQAKIDALPPAPAQPALPPSQPLPIYRNGMYHLPPVNKRHKAGPQEAALLALQKEWFWRDGDIKRTFAALEKELDARVADLFHHAISDLGRNADTCFSPDAMTEGLRHARASARRNFDEAMDCLRLHLKMALNMAVMLGR